MSPLVLPGLTFGLAALMYFTLIGFRPSLNLIIAGHMIVTMPFILRTTTASLSQLDPALLDSSQSLGASWLYTLRRVTLPLIAPGIVAGAFLAFMASIDNVPVSLFLSTARTDMLPIRMWGMMESTLDVRDRRRVGRLDHRRLRADADHGMDGGPHPPHARLGEDRHGNRPAAADPGSLRAVRRRDRRARRRRPHLLRGRAGQPARRPRMPACRSACKAETPDRPLKADLLERHEFSSQTFVPLDVGRWLIVVAPHATAGGPDLAGVRAFIATGKQGVTYKPNTWHHGLTVLDRPGRFAVFMWRDGGKGDEEFVPVAPFTIRIP